jgi:hypothetical protein
VSDTALDKRGGQVGAEDGAVIQARADELRRERDDAFAVRFWCCPRVAWTR